MPAQSIETVRKLRADAARNRERVLKAATAIFSAGGADASLEAVARRARVGIGTLYRHFPTREDLFEAVYRHEVQHLCELADRLNDEAAPLEALRLWMRSGVEFIATKKGMVEALALAVAGSTELHARSSEQLSTAAGLLMARAVAAGEIRSDTSAETLVRALVGMCYMQNQPGWQENVLRMVDIIVDGLRLPAKGSRVTRHKRLPTRRRAQPSEEAIPRFHAPSRRQSRKRGNRLEVE